MKTIKLIVITMSISSFATLKLMSGPAVGVTVQVPAPPPPAVTVQVGVPDAYVWDGYEYVGVVGTTYYYLGPNHVWLALDPVRLARWHDWEKAHADWHNHVVVNKLYRRDAQGHDHPWHGGHSNDHDK